MTPLTLFADKISEFLDPKDFLRFASTSKMYNNLSKNNTHYWRTQIKSKYPKSKEAEYAKNNSDDNPKNISKSQIVLFKRVFKSMCILCCSKTKSNHQFLNVKICLRCQQDDERYSTITKNLAKTTYCLTESDLDEIEFKEKPNSWNNSRPIKIFLLEDIKQKAIQKYSTLKNLSEHRNQKRQEKFNRRLLYQTKFTILRQILCNYYNIEILYFTDTINKYTKGLFRRYILNISKRQNKNLLDQLILLCLEMNYLSRNRIPLQSITYLDFDETVFELLFMTGKLIKKGDTIESEHIMLKLVRIGTIYSVEIDRMIEIRSSLNASSVEYNLTDYKIHFYIKNGRGNVKDITLDYIENDFVSKNFTEKELLESVFLNVEDREKMIKNFIQNRVNKDEFVPEQLLVRYKKIE